MNKNKEKDVQNPVDEAKKDETPVEATEEDTTTDAAEDVEVEDAAEEIDPLNDENPKYVTVDGQKYYEANGKVFKVVPDNPHDEVTSPSRVAQVRALLKK